jgi:hypothetical protein
MVGAMKENARSAIRSRWRLWFLALLLLLVLLLLLLLSRCREEDGRPEEAKVVFVSGRLYDGNFGSGQRVLGHLEADLECQELAQAAGLAGVFRAWISGRVDDGEEPLAHGVIDRFTQSPFPYKLVNGVRVADDWSDLTDGTLGHAIDVTERNTPVGSEARVWTNTRHDGRAWDNRTQCALGSGPDDPTVWSWSCGAPSWTAGDCQFQSGKYGLATAASGAWTGTSSSNIGCDNLFHLYCFEQ